MRATELEKDTLSNHGSQMLMGARCLWVAKAYAVDMRSKFHRADFDPF
jgi:hypothetical protein